MKHVLSIRENHYEEIQLGFKRALYRADAEAVESGDLVRLNEYNEESGIYTGRWLQVRVTHVEHINHIDLNRRFVCKQIVSLERQSSGVGDAYVVTVEGTKHEVSASYVANVEGTKREVTAA